MPRKRKAIRQISLRSGTASPWFKKRAAPNDGFPLHSWSLSVSDRKATVTVTLTYSPSSFCGVLDGLTHLQSLTFHCFRTPSFSSIPSLLANSQGDRPAFAIDLCLPL